MEFKSTNRICLEKKEGVNVAVFEFRHIKRRKEGGRGLEKNKLGKLAFYPTCNAQESN